MYNPAEDVEYLQRRIADVRAKNTQLEDVGRMLRVERDVFKAENEQLRALLVNRLLIAQPQPQSRKEDDSRVTHYGHFEKRMKAVCSMLDVQATDGNHNVSEYMLGMYNGLELAVATLQDREPRLRDMQCLKSQLPTDSPNYARGYKRGCEDTAMEYAQADAYKRQRPRDLDRDDNKD